MVATWAAADAIGQIGAPPPGESPERSVGAAIQAWVETGRVPDSIVGRRGMIAMAMNPGTPERQRLLCAFPARAVLKPGEDMLTLYQFNTRVARHYFCSKCGVYTHHQRCSVATQYAINIAYLDGIDPLVLAGVRAIDGANHHPSDNPI